MTEKTMLSNNIDVMRLIWTPDDIQNSKVQPAAFNKNDLLMEGRFISVDRTDKISVEAIKFTASRQKEKASGNKSVNREEAYTTTLNAGEIHAIKDNNEQNPLNVFQDPLEGNAETPENPAHCGIKNTFVTKSKAYALSIRTKLAAICTTPISLGDFLSSYERTEILGSTVDVESPRRD